MARRLWMRQVFMRNTDTRTWPNSGFRICERREADRILLRWSRSSRKRASDLGRCSHSGWYIVWRYLIDPTMSLEASRPVIIWRVDVVFLTKEDWKYEGSTAGTGGGGRTHTFGLRNAATKLKNAAVYQRKDVKIIGGKAVPAN